MTTPETSADKAIGRPEAWQEGRYQRPGTPVEQTVNTPAGTVPESAGVASTSVTRKDYESLEKPAERE